MKRRAYINTLTLSTDPTTKTENIKKHNGSPPTLDFHPSVCSARGCVIGKRGEGWRKINEERRRGEREKERGKGKE